MPIIIILLQTHSILAVVLHSNWAKMPPNWQFLKKCDLLLSWQWLTFLKPPVHDSTSWTEHLIASHTAFDDRCASVLLLLFTRRLQATSLKPKFHLARHVTSRHDTTRPTCRARRDERVELCCSTSSTQSKCNGSTRRTCGVVSRRDVMSQVEFGLNRTTHLCIAAHLLIV